MIAKEYNCIVCMEPITNPVCHSCFFKEIALWIQEQKISNYEKGIILKAIVNKVPKSNLVKDTCILCHKHDVAVCSYCFFKKALEALYELNVPKEVISSFKIFFNYSLWHEEYH